MAESFSAGYRRTVVLGPDGVVRARIDQDAASDSSADPSGFHIGDLSSSVHGDPSRRAQWEARLSKVAQAGVVTCFVDALQGEDGRRGDLETTVTPVPGPSGELAAFVVDTLDRGLTVRAETMLRESESRFRALAEALPHMVWVSDLETGESYFSPRWEAFTGRPVSQLGGDGYRDLVHPDDVATIDEMTPDSFAGQGGTLIFRLRHQDGGYRWMETFATAVRDEDGRIVRIVGGTNDISDRRRRERDARETTELLQAALDVTGLGRYVYYVREERLEADRRVDQAWGFDTSARVADEGLEGLVLAIHDDDRERVRGILQAAFEAGTPFDEEYRVVRPGPAGPEDAWLFTRGRVEHDERGPWRLVGVVEDVTERKRVEALRAVAQRREALGALIGGIAHDFNNLIAAVAGNARLAELEAGSGQDPAASLAEVIRGADVATELVRRMLDYSRDGVADRRLMKPGQLVDEAISLIRPTLPPKVTIRSVIAEDVPRVVGDPTQLLQIVVNLVTNAGQAIGDVPGNVAVELAPATAEERAEIGGAVDEGVRLTVSDDGPGMSAHVAAQVFEPFFTTKPAGAGSGLGLPAVRSGVRAHGGVIRLATAPGEGATFTVLLPAEAKAGAPQGQPADGEQLDGAAGPRGRVLFVDDEQALTRLAERALPLHGLSTRAFTDPEAAAQAFMEAPHEFVVLVTDQTMPGITGLELIGRVRETRPELPVILSSGYLTSNDRLRAEELGVDAVLPKPCTIDEVATTIRRLTAGA